MTDGKSRRPRSDQPLVVYGDLNCPFCFVLEERLSRRSVTPGVEWRLVEHDPELPFNGDFATPEQLEQLGVETEALLERAPDVSITLPRFRSNSRRAIEAVAEAMLVDPEKADALRRRLFGALWHEGRDIANVELLIALAEELGLPIPRGRPEAKALKQRWTHEWRAAGFRRIPVLLSSHDAVLEGLPTIERLDAFLRSGRLSASNEQACERPPRVR
ncbi:MAG: DsbA family protein [Myxococcales bacterium]|nr:DsbA family protein [Myxococcales bacterium]